jgi:hypothetical protein
MWRYLQGGFANGPVSTAEINALVEQGTVTPQTPVSNGGPWTRAGEVAELFPDASEQLGEPICGACGGKLKGDACPICNMLPVELPAVTPRVALGAVVAAAPADNRYPDLRRYLSLLAAVAEIGFGVILFAACLLAVFNAVQWGVGGAVLAAAITIAVGYLLRLGVMASVQVVNVLLDIEAHTRRLAG